MNTKKNFWDVLTELIKQQNDNVNIYIQIDGSKNKIYPVKSIASTTIAYEDDNKKSIIISADDTFNFSKNKIPKDCTTCIRNIHGECSKKDYQKISNKENPLCNRALWKKYW